MQNEKAPITKHKSKSTIQLPPATRVGMTDTHSFLEVRDLKKYFPKNRWFKALVARVGSFRFLLSRDDAVFDV